jgi:hypothetical protein
MKYLCRIYSGLVIALACFSLGAVATPFLLSPAAFRGNELVLGRVGDLAILGDLLSVLIGVMICAVCLWFKFKTPELLIRCTLGSLLLCVLTLVFLPAIHSP